jgi:catechol 2,3-dioxygenase-like lactoylglutathione lyase family enzyme
MVQGFDNIGVSVTDLQRSVAFYEGLGLREVYRNERGVLMSAGHARLFLFTTRQVDPPPVSRQLGLFQNPPGIDHISFAVGDVDAIYAHLREAGVEFDGEPQDQSWGARMVGLKDPDRNNLYLLQKLS